MYLLYFIIHLMRSENLFLLTYKQIFCSYLFYTHYYSTFFFYCFFYVNINLQTNIVIFIFFCRTLLLVDKTKLFRHHLYLLNKSNRSSIRRDLVLILNNILVLFSFSFYKAIVRNLKRVQVIK